MKDKLCIIGDNIYLNGLKIVEICHCYYISTTEMERLKDIINSGNYDDFLDTSELEIIKDEQYHMGYDAGYKQGYFEGLKLL